MQVCKNCKIEKEIKDFYVIQGYRRYTCKKCENKYSSSRRVFKARDLKRKSVEYLGGKCKKCGYKKCIQALEFNHLKDKLFHPSKMFDKNKPWSLIKKELDKCELLCANCHREFTFRCVSMQEAKAG